MCPSPANGEGGGLQSQSPKAHALDLDQILSDCGLNTAQSATAQLLVANRLIEPMSEWALIDGAERTALPGLLGVRITMTTKTLIHMLDRLRLGRGKDGELEKPMVILDAGFASKAEQRFLKDAAGVCKGSSSRNVPRMRVMSRVFMR